MQVEAHVDVRAPRNVVWDVATNIADAAKTIKGIQKIEVVDRPASGVVGLKWRETRIMFGKEATETMWITRAEEPSFYETRAESHGAIYTTRVGLDDAVGMPGVTRLSMTFGAVPQSFGAKVMGAIFSVFGKGSMRKAILKDLEDIKAAAEARA